jgi:antitoxin HicB
MRAYPAALTPDPDGGFTVTFRDVPEAITEGDTREEVLLRAEDALESALAMYVAAKEPLPTSSEAEADEVIVPLSALGMANAALYEAMREQGVGRAELARRLRWDLPQNQSRARPASRLADGARGSDARRARPAPHRRCSSRRMRQAASGRKDD